MDVSRRDVLKYCSVGSAVALAGCNKPEEFELGVESELNTTDTDFNTLEQKTAIVEQTTHGSNAVVHNLDFKKNDDMYYLQIQFYNNPKPAESYKIFISGSQITDQREIPRSGEEIITFSQEQFGAEVQVVAYTENGSVLTVIRGTFFETTDI